MPSDCKQCGGDCIKTQSKYQEYCQACYKEMVADIPCHVEQCEKTDCAICDDYLAQTERWVQYLYAAIQIRKSRRDNKNARLNQFKNEN